MLMFMVLAAVDAASARSPNARPPPGAETPGGSSSLLMSARPVGGVISSTPMNIPCCRSPVKLRNTTRKQLAVAGQLPCPGNSADVVTAWMVRPGSGPPAHSTSSVCSGKPKGTS